jgi:hypothetical protein
LKDQKQQKAHPSPAKSRLANWAKTIAHGKLGMPFRNIFDKPTLYPVRFISDAAGAVFAWKEGTCKNITETGDPGVAPLVLQTTEFYLFPP